MLKGKRKLALGVLAVLSGCADGRFEAWQATEAARAAARKPTVSIVSFQADGRTPASSVVLDLAEFSPGSGRTAAPKGAVAEAFEAAGGFAGRVLSAPATLILGVAEAVGRSSGSTTISQSGSGSVALGSSSSNGSADQLAPPPPEEEEVSDEL